MKKQQKPRPYSNRQKKPINVQLSKDDLKELLVVLKNFMVEEIAGYSRVMTHRADCHNQRITDLERINRNQEVRRISYCSHEDRFDHILYSKITGAFLYIVYKCERCQREYQTSWAFLSRKQKRGLKKLGVTIR